MRKDENQVTQQIGAGARSPAQLPGEPVTEDAAAPEQSRQNPVETAVVGTRERAPLTAADTRTQAIAQAEPGELVFDSAPSRPDDDLWLEYGKKIIADSLPAVRAAANSLSSATGVLQAIYLGILGFSSFIPASASFWEKAPFVLPSVIWL